MSPLKGTSRSGSRAAATGRSRRCPPSLDVGARRVEVRVRRDDLAGIDHGSEEDALGAAALMRGDDERGNRGRRSPHRGSGRSSASRRRLVALDEGRPWAWLDGARTGVGRGRARRHSRRAGRRSSPQRRARAHARARGRADGLDHLDPKRLARRSHRPPSVWQVLPAAQERRHFENVRGDVEAAAHRLPLAVEPRPRLAPLTAKRRSNPSRSRSRAPSRACSRRSRRRR